MSIRARTILGAVLGAALLSSAGPALAKRKAKKDAEPVPGPKIGRIHGDAKLQGIGGGRWWPAPTARELRPGERLKTGKGGEAILVFPDGGILRLLSAAEFFLEELTETSVSVVIDAGEAEFWMELPKKSGFHVKTPSAEAAFDRGVIRLRVEVDSRGGSVWEAFKGRIKLKGVNREKTTVTAGTRQRVHHELGLADSETIALVSKMPTHPEMDYASIRPVPKRKRAVRTESPKPSQKQKKKKGFGLDVPELDSW